MTTRRVRFNAERSGAMRARLMQHARAVFEERGYGASSVADIVNAAGVARGTFYVHFTSKREIFIAVVAAVRTELLAAQMRPMAQSATMFETIRNAIVHYLRAYEESARMISLIEATAASDDTILSAWLETREALLANTVHSLDQMRKRGLAAYDMPTRPLALAIGGMVERMGALRYTLGYQFDDDEFFDVITQAYVNAAKIVGDFQLERPRDRGRAANRR